MPLLLLVKVWAFTCASACCIVVLHENFVLSDYTPMWQKLYIWNIFDTWWCDYGDILFPFPLLGFRGTDCQEVLDVCDTLACDARGSIGCEDGQCICNPGEFQKQAQKHKSMSFNGIIYCTKTQSSLIPEVATGELCNNFTLSTSQCDDLACANGAQCFIKESNQEPGANTTAVCLCGGPWNGVLYVISTIVYLNLKTSSPTTLSLLSHDMQFCKHYIQCHVVDMYMYHVLVHCKEL